MSDICIKVTVEPVYDMTLTADLPFDVAVRLESIQGIGIAGVAVNDESHLVVTLSNGAIIDAGETWPAASVAAAIAAGAAFTFTQVAPAQNWYVQHNLNRPAPDVNISVAGEKVSADVSYTDNNNLIVLFTTPVAGVAQIN